MQADDNEIIFQPTFWRRVKTALLFVAPSLLFSFGNLFAMVTHANGRGILDRQWWMDEHNQWGLIAVPFFLSLALGFLYRLSTNAVSVGSTEVFISRWFGSKSIPIAEIKSLQLISLNIAMLQIRTTSKIRLLTSLEFSRAQLKAMKMVLESRMAKSGPPELKTSPPLVAAATP